MKVSPIKMLKKTQELYKNLERSKNLEVAVGLPVEKVTGKAYKNKGKGKDKTIIEVGAYHEYGIGVPKRSFLRSPLAIKEREINKELKRQFKAIIEKGKKPEKALGLVGVEAVNIIIDAFKTGGFGTWLPLSMSTIEAKGSNQILVDSAILKNAVTSVVRDVT